jgi:hypothetical protein
MLGRAADIFIPRVHGKDLNEAAIKLRAGGVGYYPYSAHRFVHVDTGPVRHWVEESPFLRSKRPRLRKKHLKLQCSLTMVSVLDEIPLEKLVLPAGALVESIDQAQRRHTCAAPILMPLETFDAPQITASITRPRKATYRTTKRRRTIRRKHRRYRKRHRRRHHR